MGKNLIETLLPLWNMSQNQLAEVIRWGPYVQANSKLWKQSTLHHTLSFSIVANICVRKLQKHVKLDEALLQRAFNFHDLGEGLTKRDVIFAKKNDKYDLQEYKAFKKAFTFLSKEDFVHYQEAFLLQFARKNPECFPKKERKIMEYLNINFKYEVLVFEALESWEYIFYPLQMYKENKDFTLIKSVLERQLDRLKFFTEIPGFKEEILGESFERWVSGYM